MLEVFWKNVLILYLQGNSQNLEKAGIATTKVEDVTNFPEILDGRVKTLNPKIHGGILAVRENKKHMKCWKGKNTSSGSGCCQFIPI